MLLLCGVFVMLQLILLTTDSPFASWGRRNGYGFALALPVTVLLGMSCWITRLERLEYEPSCYRPEMTKTAKPASLCGNCSDTHRLRYVVCVPVWPIQLQLGFQPVDIYS